MLNLAKRVVRRIVPAGLQPRGYLTDLVKSRSGQTVVAGPFKGMRYVATSVGSAYIPKLLGIYERELATTIDRITALQPPLIVDVGAAEGYYAVGLALRLPHTRMIAFETEAVGRDAVRDMADRNGVSDRVSIRATCEPADLQAALADQPDAIVIMDVEGYEDVLLDPQAVPALAHTTFLVELHEFLIADIMARIVDRFGATHDLELIYEESRSKADFPWSTPILRALPDKYVEQAVSEQRPIRMCWYFATPKAVTAH